MIMTEKEQRVYSEVYEILKNIRKEYIDELPKEVYDNIERNRDDEYIPNIDKDKTLDEQDIMNETKDVIASLRLEYWCKNEIEREEFIKLLKRNQEEYQLVLDSMMVSADSLFNHNDFNNLTKNTVSKSPNITVYKKEGIFQRVLKKMFGSKN